MTKHDFSAPAAEILANKERRRTEIPSDFYSVTRMPNLFLCMQRIRALLKLLRGEGAIPLAGRRILEVGCGSGDWLLYLLTCGATPNLLCGIDLDEQEIARASGKLPRADLRVGNAAELPWPGAFFDLVLQMIAFSTMLDDELRQAVAREMVRVLKPDGFIVWYDLRVDNPWNPAIRAVKTREIKRLFPDCSVKLRSVTLLPPLSRRVVPVSWIAALVFEKIPLLRTHLLGSIRRAGSLEQRTMRKDTTARASSEGSV